MTVLTQEQVAAYRRDGFLLGLVPIDRARLRRLRAAVERIAADPRRYASGLYEIEQAWIERPGAVVLHFLGGWRVDPELRALVADPAITAPLAQLLGVDRLRFWHDQVFYKPAQHPGVVPWHQDYSYWTRTAPAAHITLHLALDDTDEENGCLCYVPGSHRFGLLPRIPFDAPLETALALLPPHERELLRQVPARLRAGEASVHDGMTLHGSAANRSPRPRRAIVLNYMAPDVRVADASAPLLAGAPPLPVGALVEGELFPIVYDRRRA